MSCNMLDSIVQSLKKTHFWLKDGQLNYVTHSNKIRHKCFFFRPDIVENVEIISYKLIYHLSHFTQSLPTKNNISVENYIVVFYVLRKFQQLGHIKYSLLYIF